ncbi:MAG: hypothetical protein ABW066_02910 [Sedimenticola sp.]
MKYRTIHSPELGSAGLNLVASIAWDSLPAEILDKFDTSKLTIRHPSSLILIGHAGRALWSSIPHSQFQQADPIDSFSRSAATRFAERLLGSGHYQLLYPGIHTPPLQALGRQVGWHHDSPLGIGINTQWGLWFAYRALLITDRKLPETTPLGGGNPCHACASKACIAHCGGSALSMETGLDLKACAAYRLRPASPCAESCPARLACPVASQHRYSSEQVRYHYRKSLKTLQHFYVKTD